MNSKTLKRILDRASGDEPHHDDDSAIADLRSAAFDFFHATDDYSDWDGAVLSTPPITDEIAREAKALDDALDDLDDMEDHGGANAWEAARVVETYSADLARAIEAAVEAYRAAPERA